MVVVVGRREGSTRRRAVVVQEVVRMVERRRRASFKVVRVRRNMVWVRIGESTERRRRWRSVKVVVMASLLAEVLSRLLL